MRRIKITIGTLVINAELNDSKTADAIYSALPITAKSSTWGDEVYFQIPVKIAPEDPKPLVNLGDLAYWMPGSSFCIFYGSTPSSCKGEIRPASPVNVFGKIDLAHVEDLKKTKDGSPVKVEAVQ